jgi:hypothetical protein
LTRAGNHDTFVVKYTSAGAVQWVARMGGTWADVGNAICSMTDGGICVTGYYGSTTLTAFHADNTPFAMNLVNSGSNDVFIVKYSAVESELTVGPVSGTTQWAQRIVGDATATINSQAVCGTSDGGYCVTGYYSNASLTVFNPDASTFATTLTVNAGSNDAYIVKYTSLGSVQWVTRVAGAGNDQSRGICSTNDGGICITGLFTSATLTAFHASGSAFGTTLAVASSSDVFIVKYNSSGTVQWIVRIGGSGNNDTGTCICSRSDGGLSVSGYYNTNPMTLFNADTSAFGTILNNSGGSDTYVITYTSAGVVQWVARVSGVSTEEAYGICSTTDGGICITGYCASASNPLTAFHANSPNASGFATTLSNAGSNDVFIVKYDSAGTVQWITRVAGAGDDQGIAICSTPDGGICVLSRFASATLTAYNSNNTSFATTLTNQGVSGSDYFIAKYNSFGFCIWIAEIGGSGDDTGMGGIAVTSDGHIVATGNYKSSPVTVYNANATAFLTTLPLTGTQAGFVVKYSAVEINSNVAPPTGNVQWVARMGSSSVDAGRGICATTDGGICVTGVYNASMTVYNANGTAFATTLANASAFDVFIVKYTSAGTVQWVAKVNGSGSDEGNGICATTDGGICATGQSNSTPLTAYNANNTAFATTLAGNNDAFVVKYSPAGAVQWVARMGGTNYESGLGICSMTDGGICVTGYYYSAPFTAYNASGSAFATTLANNSNTLDVFVVKYNSTGAVQWVANIGGSGDDSSDGICATSDGGICVTGNYYSTTLTAYNASGSAFATTLASIALSDAFVVKYNSAGSVMWVARMGGDSYDQGKGICAMTDGGICVTGSYASSTLTVYNADKSAFATALPNTVNYYFDVFVVKYTSVGAVQWIARMGGSTSNQEEGKGICATIDGGICVTGQYYSATLTAYNANGSAFATTLANAGNNDVFVVKYSSAGNVMWVARMGGTGDDQGSGICATTDGGICVTGQYNSTTLTAWNANNTAFATTLANAGSYDVFIVKYY